MTSINNIRSVKEVYEYIREHDKDTTKEIKTKNGKWYTEHKHRDNRIDIKNEAPSEDRVALKKMDTDYFLFGNGHVTPKEIFTALQSQLGITSKDIEALSKVDELVAEARGYDNNITGPAQKKISEIKDPRAIPALVSLLGTYDQSFTFVAGSAETALSNMKGPEVVTAMISLVKEQNVTTPIRILGKIKDPSASDFLISVALNTKFKSTASKSELLKLPELEGKLDQFFENTNDPLVFKSSVSALSEKLKKFNLVGTKTEQTILSMFKESSKLQKAAVYALAESKDPKHAHVFMILLKDSDPEIRATAVRFLDGIKSGK